MAYYLVKAQYHRERAAVLETYFTSLSVEPVKEGKGWEQIKSLPRLWSNTEGDNDEI